MKIAKRKPMNLATITGNLQELPKLPVSSWITGDVSEAIGLWALYKARFWKIVKPLHLQWRKRHQITNISSFISPNQIRQGLCLIPSHDELYYRDKILTEEQMKLTHRWRWDFLALKAVREGYRWKTYPCLIEVKTQWYGKDATEGYRLFEKRDFSKEKVSGFKVFCLRVMLGDNWNFEVAFEEF